eukprot:6239597-Amphidinium_carterae.2
MQRLSLWALANLCEEPERAGACRDPDDDGVQKAMTEWMSAWKRGQYPAEAGPPSSKVSFEEFSLPQDGRRAGGGGRDGSLPRMLRAHDGDGRRRAEALTQAPGSRRKRAVLQHLRLPSYQQGLLAKEWRSSTEAQTTSRNLLMTGSDCGSAAT